MVDKGDLYLCNTSFEKTAVIDDYISLIWTDRYYAHGDIQLRFSKNAPSVDKIRKNMYFAFAKSKSHMIVSSILLDSDKNQVIVTGKCLKSLFMRRINKLSGIPDTASGGNLGAAGALMADSVQINVMYASPVADRINNMTMAPGFFPWGGGPESRRDSSAETVYDELFSLGRDSNVGWNFRYYDDFDYGDGGPHEYKKLIYWGYVGADRTAGNPDANHEIIFDPVLDNIENVSYLDSNDDFITHVAIPDSTKSDGFTFVQGWVPPSDPYNVERRVKIVRMNEKREDYTAAQWYQLQQAYARAELAKHPPQHILDGRLLSSGPFTYDFDYFLGDKVTIGIRQKNPQKARIIEYIWSYDQNGVQEYPTFKVVQ